MICVSLSLYIYIYIHISFFIHYIYDIVPNETTPNKHIDTTIFIGWANNHSLLGARGAARHSKCLFPCQVFLFVSSEFLKCTFILYYNMMYNIVSYNIL